MSDFVGEIGSQIIHWGCLLGSLRLDFLVLELPFVLDAFYLVIDVFFGEHFSHGFKTVFDGWSVVAGAQASIFTHFRSLKKN